MGIWVGLKIIYIYDYVIRLYDKETFDSINSHYKTGKQLPNDQLTEIKQHMVGFNTCDELYKSMLDIKMHTT